ncbi:hypothetical protein KAR91_15330, partial [Candidatus Pacearchaeota archaeon]|nr:hypothetical protein [Candidatus Pacearchaeota archaeon]
MIGTGAKGVMWFNPMDHLYINGDENTDGSRRFNIDTETGLAIIEKRVEGIWQPTSIETGATSVWVGKNVAVAGLGHHLATEAKDGHLHFHAHSEFSAVTGLSVHDSQIVNAYYYEEHMAVVPDESGEWTGTIYNYNYASTDHRIFKKVYFKTGATPASEFVTFRVWEGTDDTGYLIFKQSYPISEFPANTEIPLVTEGYLEFSAGQNYYIRVESNATFSLKTTVDELYPYTYGDISLVHEDNMLQTIPYIDGENYGLNQWLIHDRRIYVCNTAGVQTGTFTDNIALWDIIGTGGGSTLWNANGGILENVAGPTALLFNDGTLDR